MAKLVDLLTPVLADTIKSEFERFELEKIRERFKNLLQTEIRKRSISHEDAMAEIEDFFHQELTKREMDSLSIQLCRFSVAIYCLDKKRLDDCLKIFRDTCAEQFSGHVDVDESGHLHFDKSGKKILWAITQLFILLSKRHDFALNAGKIRYYQVEFAFLLTCHSEIGRLLWQPKPEWVFAKMKFQETLLKALAFDLTLGKGKSLKRIDPSDVAVLKQLDTLIEHLKQRLTERRDKPRYLFVDCDNTLMLPLTNERGEIIGFTPNGGSYDYWVRWLSELRTQGITPIFMTSRAKVVGELDPGILELLAHKALNEVFVGKIFSGNAAAKADQIAYVLKQLEEFAPCAGLLDDDAAQISYLELLSREGIRGLTGFPVLPSMPGTAFSELEFVPRVNEWANALHRAAEVLPVASSPDLVSPVTRPMRRSYPAFLGESIQVSRASSRVTPGGSHRDAGEGSDSEDEDDGGLIAVRRDHTKLG